MRKEKIAKEFDYDAEILKQVEEEFNAYG